MEEKVAKRHDAELFLRDEGSADGPVVLFLNSLGTDLGLWDEVVARLPDDLRVIRFDMRGHGRSSVPEPPYTMGALIVDAEAVLDACGVEQAVLVGLSLGGMVAQGLAAKRLDLVRGLVLSNTAVKMGHPDLWQERIAAVEAHGMVGVADGVLDRWFAPGFAGRDAWRDRLLDASSKGYIGGCTAIARADMISPTSGLRLPTLGIAGSEDAASPPDLVKETVDLIPGARFEIMRGVGHLPCVEDPETYAALLTGFLREIGHL
ncbi:3-oxoadipate enol-lactonase [Aestuariibius sp. 2305UL40-4]|uniref:3-oxoadipate enol-lactonase n=1 Tax=Aestuariibius violaceus TaxID=3234132 RepID=UPI00345ED490